jgi:hypothetical protein
MWTKNSCHKIIKTKKQKKSNKSMKVQMIQNSKPQNLKKLKNDVHGLK